MGMISPIGNEITVQTVIFFNKRALADSCGKNCRRRIMQNLSQKKLASRIGVTYAEKSYRKNIVNIPHVRDCRRLADASGVSIDELIGRVSDR